MKTIETVTTYNGNNQPMVKELPRLCILAEHFNPESLEHVRQNTGLDFRRGHWNNWEAQPETSDQIARLFLTYNFKTEYHDNGTTKNTIFLKFCRLEGFKVEAICFECVKRNNIVCNGLKSGDHLAV